MEFDTNGFEVMPASELGEEFRIKYFIASGHRLLAEREKVLADVETEEIMGGSTRIAEDSDSAGIETNS